ncbi:DUF6207 family protein [Streptomyces sp. NPDC003027]
MRIDERHIAESGVVVLDVTAADQDTIRTVWEGVQQLWATSGITSVLRTPGEAGVRARVYAGIRRPGTTDEPGWAPPCASAAANEPEWSAARRAGPTRSAYQPPSP